MNKIFINKIAVYLTSETPFAPQNTLTEMCINIQNETNLLETIRYLEQDRRLEKVYIFGRDIADLFSNFSRLYEPIVAAGGAVRNKAGDLLFIKRNGRWDLPKGKLELSESIETAALREVCEETGLAQDSLALLSPVLLPDSRQNITMHTYFERGTRFLKKTYWYNMQCTIEQTLVPQAEEGISDVAWKSEEELLQGDCLKNTFKSVQDIVFAVLGKQPAWWLP